jgi:hypothetical protein
MLPELVKTIAAELKARAVPMRVVYGPERGAQGMSSPRIVIEYDRDSRERVTGPRRPQANPNMVYVRAVPCRARVFAQSTEQGSRVQDHERIGNQVGDLLLVSIFAALQKSKTLGSITSVQLLSAAALEREGLETWPGVVLDVGFEVDRGVRDRTWTTEKAPEATVGGDDGVGIATDGQVHLDGTTELEPIP